MPYCGPVEKFERIAGARSNGFGYKAIIISRAHASGGRHFDQTKVISRTLATREDAIAYAARRIAVIEKALAS